MRSLVVMDLKKGKYRHYKGKFYQVLYTATHSENLEKMVVYQQLYGEHSIWVRPLDMFLENVNIDGVEVKRFEYQSE